jgi:hypothetical protein
MKKIVVIICIVLIFSGVVFAASNFPIFPFWMEVDDSVTITSSTRITIDGDYRTTISGSTREIQ